MKPNFEAIRSSSSTSNGSDYILNSGLYDIKIRQAYIKRKEGTEGKTLVLRVIKSGCTSLAESVLFIRLNNNNGKENFEKVLLDKLLVVCGIDEVKRLVPTKFSYNNKEFFEDCIPELKDKELVIQVKREFSRFNGKISDNLRVLNFFRKADKATAIEIIENKDFGAKFNSLDKSYVEATSYRDGVTKAEADAYIKAQQSARSGNFSSESNVSGSDDGDSIPF